MMNVYDVSKIPTETELNKLYDEVINSKNLLDIQNKIDSRFDEEKRKFIEDEEARKFFEETPTLSLSENYKDKAKFLIDIRKFIKNGKAEAKVTDLDKEREYASAIEEKGVVSAFASALASELDSSLTNNKKSPALFYNDIEKMQKENCSAIEKERLKCESEREKFAKEVSDMYQQALKLFEEEKEKLQSEIDTLTRELTSCSSKNDKYVEQERLFFKESSKLMAENSSLQSQVDTLKTELSECSTKLLKLEKEKNDKISYDAGCDADIEKIKKECDLKVATIETEYDENLNNIRDKSLALAKEFETENKSLIRKIEESDAENLRLNRELLLLKESQDASTVRNQRITDNELKQCKENLQEQKEIVIEIAKKLEESAQNIGILTGQLEVAKFQSDSCETQLEDCEKRKEEIETSIEILKQELEEKKNKLSEIESERVRLSTGASDSIDVEKEELKNLNEELKTLNEKLIKEIGSLKESTSSGSTSLAMEIEEAKLLESISITEEQLKAKIVELERLDSEKTKCDKELLLAKQSVSKYEEDLQTCRADCALEIEEFTRKIKSYGDLSTKLLSRNTEVFECKKEMKKRDEFIAELQIETNDLIDEIGNYKQIMDKELKLYQECNEKLQTCNKEKEALNREILNLSLQIVGLENEEKIKSGWVEGSVKGSTELDELKDTLRSRKELKETLEVESSVLKEQILNLNEKIKAKDARIKDLEGESSKYKGSDTVIVRIPETIPESEDTLKTDVAVTKKSRGLGLYKIVYNSCVFCIGLSMLIYSYNLNSKIQSNIKLFKTQDEVSSTLKFWNNMMFGCGIVMIVLFWILTTFSVMPKQVLVVLSLFYIFIMIVFAMMVIQLNKLSVTGEINEKDYGVFKTVMIGYLVVMIVFFFLQFFLISYI
jgi:predicted  nucleic acid-binding Zn-ribbon protein